MTKCKKLEAYSGDYGREFFVVRGKKSSVPPGCIFAGIRRVAALAGRRRYLRRTASCGLHRENSNAREQII